MKARDFQEVFDRVEWVEGKERLRLETLLSYQVDLNEKRTLDAISEQEYLNLCDWLKDHRVKWHDGEGRYVGTGTTLNFLKAEIWVFLQHFAEYLAECENCKRFFVKTMKRGGARRQRFCTRGGRKCRDEYMLKEQKTPEGREYHRSVVARSREYKRRRERLKDNIQE